MDGFYILFVFASAAILGAILWPLPARRPGPRRTRRWEIWPPLL
jgi:hypothetical protein